MKGLLHIEEPAAAPRIAPSMEAFLDLAFRPLYLAGALWGAVAVAIWIFAPQWLDGPLPGVIWHAHEMLWGFVATIAVGFLMTAGAAWTGINPLRGSMLAFVCALWIVARVGFLTGGDIGFAIAATAEVLFFVLAGLAMLRAVIKTKNTRNLGVPWLLIGLGVIDALYLWTVRHGDYGLLIQRFDAGLLCMAVIALLIARRVTPFFAMRAIEGLKVPMLMRSGQVQLGAAVLAIVLVLLRPMAPQSLTLAAVLAAALTVAGGIALVHIVAWKPLAVRHNPLLWILYVGYGMLGVGLIVTAANVLGWVLRPAVPIHVIAVGGFGVLIIGMVTRTALGHLGRPLRLDRSMAISYGLMLAAVVLRLYALVPTAYSHSALELSALAWIAAFAAYL